MAKNSPPPLDYVGPYLWWTLRGAGGLFVTILNVVSLILGFAILGLFLLFFSLQPASLALSFLMFLLLLVVTHYGSFLAYQTERRTREKLEEASRPRLEIDCDQQRGLYLGGMNESRAALAFLNVRNVGGGHIRNAYVRAKLVHHSPAFTGGRASREHMYRHQDVFLRWEATEERLHSFATEAKVKVAYGRNGDGYYRLLAAGGISLNRNLSYFDVYELELEIVADDTPPIRETLFLCMGTPQVRNEDGSITLYIDSPPQVEFRPWTSADDIEDELDLDQWRVEHSA
jgi:hypothetical protein